MTASEDEEKTGTRPARGSRPSVRPGSDKAQTITAPTPHAAQTPGRPNPSDLADGDDAPESPSREEEHPADG